MIKYLVFISVVLQMTTITANENIKNILNTYAWEKRQLMIFSPKKDHPEYLHYLSIESENKNAFEERNLHAFHVIENHQVTLNENNKIAFGNQEARAFFQVPIDQFRIVLIGYDQEEKLRLKRSNMTHIFSKIDQMPMRIREMENSFNAE